MPNPHLKPERIENAKKAMRSETTKEATMLTHILDFIRIRTYLKMVTAPESISSRAPV